MIREEKREKLFFYLLFAGLIFGGLLVLQSCAAAPADPLAGTEWQLKFIGKSTLIENTAITMNFADGQVGGNASCNSYFAAYKVDGNKLTFDQAGMTEMYCTDPAGVMDQETRFLQTLALAVSFEIKDSELWITLSDTDILVFTEAGLSEQ